MGIVRKARMFAEHAHEGQVRKYTYEPYINHPVSVALLVNGVMPKVDYDSDIIAAALLHDVVEDTKYTIEDIQQRFGTYIASLVDDLTDVSKPSDGNRATRKEIDRQHTAKASPEAKTIKLADLIDNSSTITKYDAEFASVYMREKEALLKVLTEGNRVLFQMASNILAEYRESKD